MRLLDQLPTRLGDLREKATDPRAHARDRWGRESVAESEDLARILALPRRPRPTLEEQSLMATVMTSLLTLGPVDSCLCRELRLGIADPCITALLPIQGWYLYEAAQVGGALGHIVVGGGKTGIDILLAMVIPNCRRVVVMIPPNLREQFAIDYLCWRQHFQVPNLAGGPPPHLPNRPTLSVLAYSELSSPRFATWLKAESPDALIGDESQNLKDKNSTRTDRFLRFYIDTEESNRIIPFFPHSGSMTEDSLDNYGHLSALALREGSPVPLETRTLAQWCDALDAPARPGMPQRRVPGALMQLCNPGETVRQGFKRRLIETPGVITSGAENVASKLTLRERVIKPPAVITNAIKWVRGEKKRPDGELLVELTEIANCCRQLASGFFYVWRYPRGEPEALIDEWFTKRQSWHRELRERLEHRVDLLDSRGLCENAARRFYAPQPHPEGSWPEWNAQTWPAWDAIEDQVHPVKHAIWVDDFLVRDAAAFAAEEPAIVWVLHEAFAAAVSKAGDLPLYASGDCEPVRLNPTDAMLERRRALIEAGAWKGGDIANNWITTEDGSRSIVCAIRAHGTGKNLQAFKRCLVANLPVKGWEQLLGRLHRKGQSRDVDVFVYRHTREVRDALDKARDLLATYVQETTDKAEKLLSASVDW